MCSTSSDHKNSVFHPCSMCSKPPKLRAGTRSEHGGNTLGTRQKCRPSWWNAGTVFLAGPRKKFREPTACPHAVILMNWGG